MEKRPPAAAPTPAEDHVLDASGHVHFADAPIDLSVYRLEGWIALAFFWILALTVCYQFFTRYFMNDSASWTEEIARYLLICTVFLGIAPAVRDSRNIHVDFLYRLIPRGLGRVLSTMVDIVQLVFLAYAVVLIWQLMQKMGSYRMTIIDLPMNLVYGVCLIGFACSAVRAAQVAVENWRRGYSVLDPVERVPHPDAVA